jgi:hypothetical protein
VNFFGGRAIQSSENAMKISRSPARPSLAQSFAQFLGSLRAGEEALKKGAQIKSGSPDDDRKVSAGFDFLKYPPGLARVFAGIYLIRRSNAVE